MIRDQVFSMTNSLVKNLPAMQETWLQSLGWEDPLEEEMATHASILAWEIPCTEKPGQLQSMVHKESEMTEHAILDWGAGGPCRNRQFAMIVINQK